METHLIPGFNVLANPTGPLCNLNCSYCYYLEKEALFCDSKSFAMDASTLEIFTRKYIHEQPGKQVNFVWQGGEPTLLGIDYYKTALSLQRKYGQGKEIMNSLQTNGTLLTDAWCQFFKDNNFLIGISIDGPEAVHDRYRLDKGGKGSFKKVIRGMKLLKKHGVEFNTLTVINSLNVENPVPLYNFLKKEGSGFMQFIPLVYPLNSWSVPAVKFGQFLIAVFDEWVKRDVGKYFVQTFDAALANEIGVPAGVCLFNGQCGNCIAIEHNGDVFSCDHFVDIAHKLGNIHHASFKNMLAMSSQQRFGDEKFDDLPEECHRCNVYNYCRGECPKNRVLKSINGKNNLNYLCEGYKVFFRHIGPYMKFMANEILHQRSPANVMYR